MSAVCCFVGCDPRPKLTGIGRAPSPLACRKRRQGGSFSRPRAPALQGKAEMRLRSHTCELINLLPHAAVSYDQTLALQRRLRDEKIKDPSKPDSLILLEHPPTYTLGTGSSLDHLRFQRENPPDGSVLAFTERGGEVTFHAPGQIVAYPILRLERHRKDLHWYMWALEEVVLIALRSLGIVAGRKPGLRGVWIGDAKVAATGVKISRWVTMHGIAVNVRMEDHRAGFERIVPCGIDAFGVTEIADFVAEIDVPTAGVRVRDAFQQVFAFDYDEVNIDSVLPSLTGSVSTERDKYATNDV